MEASMSLPVYELPRGTKSTTWYRWESRLQSVAAVRLQAKEIRDALLEARQTVNDTAAKVEAQFLAEEVASYGFLICSVVWFDILTSINQAGFADAQSTANELCEALNIEPELREKRLRSTKRQFAYEAADEPMNDALKKLEVTFFNTVVDCSQITARHI
ncbi:hypothetical protein N1851_021992 [Merluccius polli]|uniref:Uncharacterized protein n=1 Tax=Merluccius polli TaxID=89951 RepID=A0AA47MJ23_MERPO|nr:hypothetical protein N1851_021992 [Merluccius polli]